MMGVPSAAGNRRPAFSTSTGSHGPSGLPVDRKIPGRSWRSSSASAAPGSRPTPTMPARADALPVAAWSAPTARSPRNRARRGGGRPSGEASAAAPPLPPDARQAVGLGEALAYPLTDGPGLALLFVFPPFLTIMSVPVFDIVLFFQEGPRGGFNPLALLVRPSRCRWRSASP